MHNGIYLDKKTKKWYIHTSVKGKTCTIRGFNSKKEADDNYDVAIEKWKREHGLYSGNQYIIVADEYINYRARLVRQESLRKDKALIKYYTVIFAYDNLNNVFNEKRMKIIYQDVVTNTDFSTRKKMRLVFAFRDFAKYCFLCQYINQDTYNKVLITFIPVKLNKQNKESKRFIPESDFKALVGAIDSANDNLYKTAIFVLYRGGLRISEMLGLTSADIDMSNKIIKVQRQLLTNGTITGILKTPNSYRQVPMNNDLYNLFKNIELTGERVFTFSHTTFKRKLAQYERKANVPLYSAHEFRHTRCFELAKRCTTMSDVVYCAKVLGHSTSIFLDVYCSHLDNSLANKFFD